MHKVKTRLSLFAIVLTLILMLSSTSKVLAYTTNTWALPTNLGLGEIDSTNHYHVSGRFIVVYGDTSAGGRTLYARTYDSTGTLEGTYSNQHGGGHNTYYQIASVTGYNTTHALIWTFTDTGSQYIVGTCFLFNVITGGFTEYTVTGSDVNANYISRGFYMATYGGEYYAISHLAITGNNTSVFLYKFNGTHITQEANVQTHASYVTTISAPLGFESPYDSSIHYLMFCTDVDTQPEFWEVDLDTGSFTYHATLGTTNHYASDDYRINYLDGGIQNNGSNYYLYHTWVYGNVTSGIRTGEFRQFRLEYDDLALLPANITDQNIRYAQLDMDFIGSQTVPAWITGTTEHYYEYTTYSDTMLGAIDYVAENNCTIEDWFNMGISDVTTTFNGMETVIDFPHNTAEVYISRPRTSPFQFNIDNQATPYDAYVYGGLSALSDEWDVTLSYSPTDDPLETDTFYTFTGQTLLNGVGSESTVLIYLDGGLLVSEITNSQGVFTWEMRQSQAGDHLISISVYVDNEQVYLENFTYIWSLSASDTLDPNVVVPVNASAIILMLPYLFIFGAIPFATYELTKSIIGLLIGVSISIMVGVMTGYIPLYVFFIFLIVIGFGFVWLLGLGRGGG